MQAWNNLGVQLLRTNRADEAVTALRTAVKLDRAAPLAYCNLAGALGGAGNLTEGEEAARKAIALDPAMARARYLLALSLYVQRKNADEALQHLSKITGEYPRANKLAAAVLWQAGKQEEARARLALFHE
jgi:protein O-GlcNAc transferase